MGEPQWSGGAAAHSAARPGPGRDTDPGTEPAAAAGPAEESERLPVTKTYQLYLGGTFPRSESGRVYPILDTRGNFLAHAAQASRKDARDAVAAASEAAPPWSHASAYHRGQVLYRIAELLEGRRDQFAAEVAAAEGYPARRAGALVDATVDRWVWYAGWTDKIATVFGSVNAAPGPYLCLTEPRPVGVVAVLAPQQSSLLGLASVLAPVIAAGNTAVVVASQQRPLPAVTLAEVLATSDLPAGVVNVLTGRTAELAPWLAAHPEVTGLDLCGAPQAISADLERTAAATLTRLLPAAPAEPDWMREPDTRRLRAFLEFTTTWCPAGP